MSSKRRERKRRQGTLRVSSPQPIARVDQDGDADAQDERIAAILGDGEFDREEALKTYFAHLVKALVLPCEVEGREDFRWEERYIFGGDLRTYERLRKTQPSYRDRYELLEIGRDWGSPWMLFFEDICARCRRKTDDREFVLGLAELDAADRASPNWRLLDDYGTWLVNTR
jgi:hypothetical protein